MLRRSVPLALAAVVASAAAAPADHHEKMDVPDIKGFYALTGGAKYGEKIPADRIKDTVATVTKDTFAVVDKDQKDLYTSTYKIVGPAKDEDGKMMKDTYEVDLVSTIPKEGTKAPALIKVEMGTKDGMTMVTGMTLIYSLTDRRPKDFAIAEGEKELMFEMKKKAAPATVDGTPADEDEEQG